ncbi:hypothetical protein AUP68_02746 [Ilyonectria robusta]
MTSNGTALAAWGWLPLTRSVQTDVVIASKHANSSIRCKKLHFSHILTQRPSIPCNLHLSPRLLAGGIPEAPLLSPPVPIGCCLRFPFRVQQFRRSDIPRLSTSSGGSPGTHSHPSF